jgi:putrescine aminotransferase
VSHFVRPEHEISELYKLDRTYWLHPQGDLDAPNGSIPQLMFSHGSGTTLTDLRGRSYIDAMASLWNVNVGHGRTELAAAAGARSVVSKSHS